jgi:3-hydroxy-3-methylglutaryl CoA synthase/uncharacterized OB-fold protein
MLRGVIAAAAYIPHHRLDRAKISEAMGSGGGKGTRAVASYDEDTTTLAVEAARLALRPLATPPTALLFATTQPTYVDKTNATIVHAALRLDTDIAAYDVGGGIRSGIGAIRNALRSNEPAVLVAAADIRTGLPASGDEASGGDAGAALVIGDESAGTVIAEHLGGGSATREFLDQWRKPGDLRPRHWEERFAETQYAPLVEHAWNAALKDADLSPDDIGTLVVCGSHSRAVKAAVRAIGSGIGRVADALEATIGNPGAAQAGVLLTAELEMSDPNTVVALVDLADGVDVVLLRTTDAIASWQPDRTVAAQSASGDDRLPYTKFLSWRGVLDVEPPRRPEPARMSASAAGRSLDWKYGFVGSRDRSSGAVHLPPARVSFKGDAVDDMDPAPMADITGTVVTFTVDRLVYSPSPPVVFAVVDFDGGGRLPVELTDVDASEVRIGDRVEMTFRRLNAADGIANYFWKARPVREVREGSD